MILNESDIYYNEEEFISSEDVLISRELLHNYLKKCFNSNDMDLGLLLNSDKNSDGYYEIYKSTFIDCIYTIFDNILESLSENYEELKEVQDECINYILSNVLDDDAKKTQEINYIDELEDNKKYYARKLLSNKNNLLSFIEVASKLIDSRKKIYFIKELLDIKETVIKSLTFFLDKDLINKISENFDYYYNNQNYDEAQKVLKNAQTIIKEHWKEFAVTDFSDFKQGDPFKIIVHAIPDTVYKQEDFLAPYISSSLIIENNLRTFNDEYGFILEPIDIVSASSDDMYSKNNAETIEDATGSLLPEVKSPELILEENRYLLELNKKNNSSKKVYNEVFIDVTKGLKAKGIFCITTGSKSFDKRYRYAKELQKLNPNLEIIEIDRTFYPNQFSFKDKKELLNELEEAFYERMEKSSRKDYYHLFSITITDRDKFDYHKFDYFFKYFQELKKKSDYSEDEILDIYSKNVELLDESIGLNEKYTDEEIIIKVKYGFNINNNPKKEELLKNLNILISRTDNFDDYERLNNIVEGLGTFIELSKKYNVPPALIDKLNDETSIKEINQAMIDYIITKQNAKQSELDKLNEQLESVLLLLNNCNELLFEKENIKEKIDNNNEVLKHEVNYSITKNNIETKEESIRQNDFYIYRIEERDKLYNQELEELNQEIEKLNRHKLLNIFKIDELKFKRDIILKQIEKNNKYKPSITEKTQKYNDEITILKQRFFEEIGISYDEYEQIYAKSKEYNLNYENIDEEIKFVKKEIETIKNRILELKSEIILKKEEMLTKEQQNQLAMDGYDLNNNSRKMGYIKVSLLFITSFLISIGIIVLTILINI